MLQHHFFGKTIFSGRPEKENMVFRAVIISLSMQFKTENNFPYTEPEFVFDTLEVFYIVRDNIATIFCCCCSLEAFLYCY